MNSMAIAAVDDGSRRAAITNLDQFQWERGHIPFAARHWRDQLTDPDLPDVEANRVIREIDAWRAGRFYLPGDGRRPV